MLREFFRNHECQLSRNPIQVGFMMVSQRIEHLWFFFEKVEIITETISSPVKTRYQHELFEFYKLKNGIYNSYKAQEQTFRS